MHFLCTQLRDNSSARDSHIPGYSPRASFRQVHGGAAAARCIELRQRMSKVNMTAPPPESQFVDDYAIADGDGGVDRAWYLETHSDVAAVGADPVAHYLRQGWREGRDPRADFSSLGYLAANMHVEGNPLLHYLRTGERERGTDWYRLWRKGLFYPKGEQQVSPDAPFGAPGRAKLLFAGHEASRSGAPLILLRLMEGLQAITGAELYLLLERGGPLLEDYRRIAHVFVNHNGMLHREGGPRLSSMLGSIARPKPELAICNSADSWRLISAFRAAGVPHLISLVHERVIHYTSDIWRSIRENSDHVVLPADAVKAATTVVQPQFRDAYVIPQGLLAPEFGRGNRNAAHRVVREQLGLSPDTLLILGCGSQNMRKGTDLFVQLAARVCAQSRRKIHFLWVGAKEPNSVFSRLVELDISLLNLKSTVSLLDEVSVSEPYFLAADAFVLTSRDDPFPCVVHEAMACALPVFIFDGSGGAKEAIAHDCGIVVPYLDIETMAGALISALENPGRSGDMGRRAEERVRSVYRFSDYAKRIWDVCESVTGRSMPDVRASIA
jgi:glycosyltransferase involved in cell wall biosynthesis